MMSTHGFNIEALHDFLNQPINTATISHVAKVAGGTVQCSSAITPCCQGLTLNQRDFRLPTLNYFVFHLVKYSEVTTLILVSTLVYLARLRRRLGSCLGSPSSGHRTFLAALILSSKYHDDTPYMNDSWVYLSQVATQKYSFWLNRAEINEMERQLLRLLEWDLSISVRDLYIEMEPLLAPIFSLEGAAM